MAKLFTVRMVGSSTKVTEMSLALDTVNSVTSSVIITVVVSPLTYLVTS